MDPNATKLGVYFDAAAFPLNMDIDARTMRSLDASVGLVGAQVDQQIEAVLASL